MVTPEVPRVPPLAPRSVRPAAPSPDAAPVVEPENIAPEPPRPAFSDPDVGELPNVVIGGHVEGAFALGSSELPPPAPQRERAPIRLTSQLQGPERTKYVAPDYPAIARSARVSGVVILEAVIAEDGSVRDVRVLRSIPLLDRAAEDAVKQWRFTPTLFNGQTIPIVMTVTVNFTLE